MAKAKKKKWKVVAAFVAVVVAVGGLFTLFKKDDKLEKLNGLDFKVAAVDDEGKVYDSDTAIVTKEKISTNELTITYDDDVKIEYRIHTYTKDGVYIGPLDWMTEDYKFSVEDEGSSAVYAIIEVRPQEGVDEDGKISWREKIDYLKGIEVEYNPELIETEESGEGVEE